jgi:hypothetical protein
MKIAVYTCITGGYDQLIEPVIDRGFDYYYFSDSEIEISGLSVWKFVKLNIDGLSHKDLNRYVKINFHLFFPDYDATLYVDGSIAIKGSIGALLRSLIKTKYEIFLFQHPLRRCIYSEGAACSHDGHDWIWKVALQMRKYNNEHYPPNNGLYEAGVIFRKNTETIRSLMTFWWDEYSAHVKRDQLSLPYLAWKRNVFISSLGENNLRSGDSLFVLYPHKNKGGVMTFIKKLFNRSFVMFFSYDIIFNIKNIQLMK